MRAPSEALRLKDGFFARLFASFFFAGYLPKAPGTWGAGFTAIILYFVWPPQWYYQLLIIGAFYIFGAWVSGRAERYFGHDGRPIVIDEVVGQMVTLFMAPRVWQVYLLGFLIFRLFDIIKPPPCRLWESYPRGWGVMADDLAAGAYAATVLQLVLLVVERWGGG